MPLHVSCVGGLVQRPLTDCHRPCMKRSCQGVLGPCAVQGRPQAWPTDRGEARHHPQGLNDRESRCCGFGLLNLSPGTDYPPAGRGGWVAAVGRGVRHCANKLKQVVEVPVPVVQEEIVHAWALFSSKSAAGAHRVRRPTSADQVPKVITATRQKQAPARGVTVILLVLVAGTPLQGGCGADCGHPCATRTGGDRSSTEDSGAEACGSP